MYEVLIILFFHWLADFVMQTDEMAKNKSSSNIWLGKHVAVYTGVMTAVWLPLFKWPLVEIMPWVLLNGILHFGIDWVTSRASAKLWANGDVHNFFVIIGADQWLHAMCLLMSFKYMVLT